MTIFTAIPFVLSPFTVGHAVANVLNGYAFSGAAEQLICKSKNHHHHHVRRKWVDVVNWVYRLLFLFSSFVDWKSLWVDGNRIDWPTQYAALKCQHILKRKVCLNNKPIRTYNTRELEQFRTKIRVWFCVNNNV